MDNVYNIIEPLSGVLGFFILWNLVVFLVSKISGWSKIVEKYPDTYQGASGEKKNFQSVRMRTANYSLLVNFEALPQGLRMKTFIFFKFSHKSILIPWAELERLDYAGIFGYMCKFGFKSLPGYHFLTYKGLGEWILSKRKSF